MKWFPRRKSSARDAVARARASWGTTARGWASRPQPDREESAGSPRPVLIYALEGFLNAGSAPDLAARQLVSGQGQIVHRFDVDDYYDYRARRPLITFRADHYQDFDEPTLNLVLEHDQAGTPYLVLSGPEPDFRWERFVAEVITLVDRLDISLVVGLGGVPMGVPHTRPSMITAHATRPDLVDRRNLWSAEVRVPSSAQSLLEYRMLQQDRDAVGYVVHVPHYLAQIEYPSAAVALLDAVVQRTGLVLDYAGLRNAQREAMAEIEQQIAAQDGEAVLEGLEEQYDAFTEGAAQSLVAEDTSLPSGDELAEQLEQFLARQRKDDQG